MVPKGPSKTTVRPMRSRACCLWVLVAACGRTGLDGTTSTLVVQPTAIDFGAVELRSTATATLTLMGSGLTPSTVKVDASDGGTFAWSGSSFTFGAHGTAEVQVYFRPSELGPVHATLYVESRGANLAVPITGSGAPFTCDPQTPDGTSCQLWWAPCARATCEGGVCHSQSAEAEMPGEVRWSVSGVGLRPLVSDELGDSFNLIASGGILAIDPCGSKLWQSTVSYDWLLLAGETVVASSAGGRIDGLSRHDGTSMWSDDVGQILGCTSASCVGLRASQPVLTNQGNLLVFTTSSNAGQVRPSLINLAIDGGVQWTLGLASEPNQFAIESAVGDLAGNSYIATAINSVPSSILSYDGSGMLRPGFPLAAPRNDPGRLAVNGTLLVGAGDEWELDGMGASEINSPAGLGSGWCGDVGAADAHGTLYCFTSRQMPSTVMAVPAVGTSVQTDLPSGLQAVSNLVLGDPAELFVIAGPPSAVSRSSTLVAIDPGNQQVAWTVQPFSVPTNPGSVLSLSAAATLLAADPQGLYGVFAGQVRSSASAFWSRTGGSPENRNAPAPTAGP